MYLLWKKFKNLEKELTLLSIKEWYFVIIKIKLKKILFNINFNKYFLNKKGSNSLFLGDKKTGFRVSQKPAKDFYS